MNYLIRVTYERIGDSSLPFDLIGQIVAVEWNSVDVIVTYLIQQTPNENAGMATTLQYRGAGIGY